MTLTISLSLNATLADSRRQQTFALPLVWIAMPLTGWRGLVRQIRKVRTAFTLVSIGWRALVWGCL